MMFVSKTFGEQFTFDTTGNWTQYNRNGTLQTRTHNAANEILTISGGNTLVSHDRNGCMTKIPKPLDGTSGYTLVYDAWNRLTQVKDGTTVVATYVYDARNHRIKKTVGNTVTLSYFNRNWQEVESTTAGVTTTYVYGLRYIDDVVCRVKNTEVLYALQDPNWNVVALVNTSGTVQERMTYDSFGKPTFRAADFTAKTTSSYNWTKTFTGQVYDVETGLMLYRNRYYHPGLGRFITRDPIGYRGGDSNLYRYVYNWSTRYIDHIGLWGADVHNDMTAVWLQESDVGLRPIVATLIAQEDEGTDGVFGWISPLPFFGDQSWHFNRNPDNEYDSRLSHASYSLAEAIRALCRGEAYANVYEYLGQGLHALQDYYAHGDYGRDCLNAPIMAVHNSDGMLIPGWGSASFYPDNPDLDAVGSDDGRPAGAAIVKGTSGPSGVVYGPSLYEPSNSAIYKFGHKRILATKKATKKFINDFLRGAMKKCGCDASALLAKSTSF